MEERSSPLRNNPNSPARSTAVVTNDGAGSISNSLNRLSINVENPRENLPLANSTLGSPKGSSTQAASPTTPQLRKSHSRRTSAANSNGQPPLSPRPTRRSSGIINSFNDVPTSPGRPQLGRSASHNLSRSTCMNSNSALPSPMKETPPISAASIAAAYMKKDLLRHEGLDKSTTKPQTVVIIHDSCYGHRYSRPKTSKGTLSLIVERPERIQAGILGISSAYALLGGRYAGGHSAPNVDREPDGPLPFYIRKTSRAVPLTSSAVTNVHGTKWMLELKTMCESAETKLASGGKELSRPDDSGGPSTQQTKAKLHEGDLYLCKESLDAFQGALGGVFEGVDAVFQGSAETDGVKRAFVCIRPPGHHCSSDYPSGFCWLNNVHVGIEHATQIHGLTHTAIIDFDLHHGDGSQAITWQRNARSVKATKALPTPKKAAIGYFSLHDINSYPCEYGDTEKVQSASLCIENAHGQSIWNVHLQPWRTEEEFWSLYEDRYLVLLDKARAFLLTHTQRLLSNPGGPPPKAAIFLSAGFDASEWEGEGMQRHKVNVPTTFYARFTADIIKLAQEEGTAVDGRVISVLEGGYSDRALTSGILSHITGLVDLRLPEKLRKPGVHQASESTETESPSNDCTEWWRENMLKELEEMKGPTLIQEAPKKQHYIDPPTYSSPTQSFTAKIIDPSKVMRSSSATVQATGIARPKVESVAPAVDWVTAARELSKLLIPTDRQIRSYRHEELSEPRVKKERQPVNAHVQTGTKNERMQLRGKKSNFTNRGEVESEAEALVLPLRPASQGSRRQTMPSGSFPLDELSGLATGGFMQPTAQSQRRSSIASTSHSIIGEQEESDSRSISAAPNIDLSGLNVRKTRRQSGIMPDVTKAATASKAPPLPKIPANRAKASKTAAITPIEAQLSTTQVNDDNGVGIDDMTSGFKKLILKMPSNETSDRIAAVASKVTRKTPGMRALKSAPVRKPAARGAKKTPIQTPVKDQPNVLVAPVASAGQRSEIVVEPPVANPVIDPIGTNASPDSRIDTLPLVMTISDLALNQADGLQPSLDVAHAIMKAEPVGDGTSTATHTTEPSLATSAFHMANSPATNVPLISPPVQQLLKNPFTSASATTPPTLTDKHNFIPYEPPGGIWQPANGFSKPPSEPLTWLPPNSATPVALRRGTGKENLPIFTSDGHIPFAMPAASAVVAPASPTRNDADPNTGAGATTVQSHDAKQVPANASGLSTNVWDVPSTPGR